MRRSFFLSSLALIGLATVLAVQPDAAIGKGKPGGGGTGGGDTPTGVIYYAQNSRMHVMNADGTNKTALPENVWGEPSNELHNGHRVFIDGRWIEGEFFPNGDPRVELFAVRGDGNESYTVQVTNDPALQIQGVVRWGSIQGLPDSTISFAALRWDLTTGRVISSGIYVAVLDYDTDGNVSGVLVAADPAMPLVEGPFLAEDRDGDGTADDWSLLMGWHDWAPDGSAMVWATASYSDVAGTVQITDFDSSPASTVQIASATVFGVRWVPDGTRICITSELGIETVALDGSNRQTIVSDKSRATGFVTVNSPQWSPTGKHLAYKRYEISWKGTSVTSWEDVMRARSDGSENTNLTGDIDSYVQLWGWRK